MPFYPKQEHFNGNYFRNEEVPFPRQSYITTSLRVKGNAFVTSERKSLKKPKESFYINGKLPHKGIPRGIKSILVKDRMESIFDTFEDPNVVDSFYNFLFASKDHHLEENRDEIENSNYDPSFIDDNGNPQEHFNYQTEESNAAENADEEFTNQILESITEAILEVEQDDETLVIDDFEYDEVCDNFEEEMAPGAPINLDEKDVDEFDFILRDVLLDLIDVDDSSGGDVEQEWENIIDIAFSVNCKNNKNCFNFDSEEQGKHKFGDKFFYAGSSNEENNFEEYGITYLSDKAIYESDFVYEMKKRVEKLLCKHEDCPPPCYLFLNNNDREFLHKYIHPPAHSPSCPATDIVNKVDKNLSYTLRSYEINHLPIPPRETEIVPSYEEEKRLLKFRVNLSELDNVHSKLSTEEIMKAEMMNRMWL